MTKLTEMETFAISDHRSSTYSNIINPTIHLPEDVTFSSKRSWFKKKWFISLVSIFIICLIIQHLVHRHFNDEPAPKTSQQIERQKSPVVSEHHYISEHHPPPLSIEDVPDYVYNHAQIYFDSSMNYLVEPLHYNITIEPFLETSYRGSKRFTFMGELEIVMRSRQELDSLVLGAMDLSVEKLILKKLKNYQAFNNSREVIEWIKVGFDAYDTVNGTLHLELDTPMFPLQTYALHIHYSGHIQELPYGFFRLFYADKKSGDLKWVIGTNTEIPFARAIFPCFDAPDLETTFQLSIGHHRNSAVISNIGHAEAHVRSDGWIWEKYETSNKLPLSSISFAVTNFKNKTKSAGDIEFNVWTSADHSENSIYILDIAPKIIHCLETYFKLPSTVKQINIFGLPQRIPRQKVKIGMIYVSESDITVNRNDTSEQQKESIALQLAFNLIEQFIDSYVVFEWDSDEWIKESLVQYLSYQFIHYIEPGWGILKKFQVDIQQTEMEGEVENAIHKPYTFRRWKPEKKTSELHYMFPVNETSVFDYSRRTTSLSMVPATDIHINPKIYTQLYERKSIDKVACVFRMIQQMISESVFKRALRKFLDRKTDKMVTDGTDLWKTLTAETRNSSYIGYKLLAEHVSIQSVVEDWIYSNSYPLLTVKRDYENQTITFRQTAENPETFSTSKSCCFHHLTLWHIPISYTTEYELYFSASSPRYWMNKVREMKKSAPAKLTSDKWILVNPAQSAFYRVHYDMKNWELLIETYKKGYFPETIRAQLLDDALFLGRKGLLDHEFSLDMMNLLIERRESQYVVWRPVFRHLKYIQEMLKETEELERKVEEGTALHFKKYVRKLITPTFEYLQSYLKNTNMTLRHNEKLLRSEIFLWACAVDHEDCKSEVRIQFDEWKNSSKPEEQNPIEADMRYAVLCSVMAEGKKSDYDFLMKKYKKTRGNVPYKYEYLKSLFCYQKPEIIKFLLSNTLEKVFTIDHLNEIQDMWTAVSETFYEFEDIFTTFVDHWSEINSKFADFKPIIETILKAVTKNVTTRKELTKLKDFQKNFVEEIPNLKVLQDAEKSLREKLTWKENRLHEFDAWVRKTLDSDLFKESSPNKNSTITGIPY